MDDSGIRTREQALSDLETELTTQIDLGNVEAVEKSLATVSTPDAVRALLHLKGGQQEKLLELIAPGDAASIVERLPEEQAADIVERLDVQKAAGILHELDAADTADIVQELNAADAEDILAQMDPEEAEDVRALAQYAADTAGGLMSKEVFVFSRTQTVRDVLHQFLQGDSNFERFRGQHPYVTDSRGRLSGVVSLRTLLTSKRGSQLSDVMSNARSVSPETPMSELEDIFDDNPFLGIPVVSSGRKLLGVVSRAALADASLARSEKDALKTQGVISDELRSMATWPRARRRLSWLSVNIGLNILAASVIALYEETLAAVIALAVFLPIVSDMSGCSGNQAVAVSLRELALGTCRPTETLRVWFKEISVGLINGAALGLLLGVAAWAWKGNIWIGVVVGLALGLNTLVAVSIGGVIPLLLKRRSIDPAVASGPMLTTITDMCGFFLVLSLATAMLPLLKM